jgi:hypothetical protein
MIGLIEHLGQIFHMRINKYYLSPPYVKKTNICGFYSGFKKHWTYYKVWI